MEIDLLAKYPKTKRDSKSRGLNKTEEDRKIARRFDRDFFDGDRKHGYGGFSYNPKYWEMVVKDFVSFYGLKPSSKILDVGCARGFMLYDFQNLNLNFELKGIDISPYAISTSKEEVRSDLIVGNAKNLPFPDKEFDLVISINTIHNLEKEDCGAAIREMSRVSKKNCYLTVDAFRNKEEEEAMYNWNLTAKTIMSKNEWLEFFKQYGYEGDYFWFIP